MATTPNYSFSVYSSTDTDVRFLDFRVATAGSQSTSNFYVIDTVLKQHSDAIDSINATPSAFVVKGTYSSGSLYTASVANYPGYKNEQLIVLSLNQKNTGAVQININGTTNKDVMKYGSDGVLKAVDAGDFVANSPVLCLYDGTRFVVIGITSASSITVTGEAGDILQIADDGTIESSGKKAAQPNGIATLDENGNVVQVANMANSAAAVYSGEPVTVEYAGAQRIAAITAYGENAQGGTVEAPVALTGVDSVFGCGRNLLPNKAITKTVAGITYTVKPDKSVTVKGTVSSWGNIVIDADFSLPAGTYTLNSNTKAAGVNLVIGKDTSGTKHIAVSETASKTFELPTPIKHCVAYIAVAPDSVVDTTVYPMLNLGSAALPYEPYQGSVTQLPIPRPLRRVGDVKDKCVTRQDYESAEKLVVTYNVGFVELDGTEASHIFEGMFYLDYSASWPTPANRVNGVCSHYPYGAYGKGKIGLTDNGAAVVYNPNGDYTGDEGGLANWKAYLAAQKEAGTPVQVAYQRATPETYATDPLDIDNAAGPVTVLTGGEVEVRMTELVGTRSDVSNNTVAFTETAQDADIASGEKLSVLFGKIKKRFSVVNKLVNGAVYPNLLDNSDFTNPVNQRGSTSYSGGGTYCIDRWDIASTATVAVVSDGIKITATTLSGIRQKIENITDGQLLVFQLCDNADTVYTQAFAASTTQAEYTTDFGKFRFVLNSGGVLTISILLNAGERTFKWAKLEKGSVATPYVPKGYGAELAECLRYFQRVHADWRIYPTLKDMLYRFSQSTLQVMRIKPTISAHGTPYTFGCTINALDAQPMAFTVETKITEQGQNSAAASMLGYFDLSADL